MGRGLCLLVHLQDFQPYPDARMYRLANTPGLLCPPIKASLEIFKKTYMSEIAKKCRLLTGYLEARIIGKYGCNDPNSQRSTSPASENNLENGNQNGADDWSQQSGKVRVEILTPSDINQRGAQLSMSFSVDIIAVFEELRKRGVLCTERKPRVIRAAPAPLYCSFEDVHRFMKYLNEALIAAGKSSPRLDSPIEEKNES